MIDQQTYDEMLKDAEQGDKVALLALADMMVEDGDTARERAFRWMARTGKRARHIDTSNPSWQCWFFENAEDHPLAFSHFPTAVFKIIREESDARGSELYGAYFNTFDRFVTALTKALEEVKQEKETDDGAVHSQSW